MLLKYNGNQTAISFEAGGRSIRLQAGAAVLLTKAQADELKKRPFTKRMVKLKLLEFKTLDALSKDELLELASANGHKVKGKEKVSDLISLLQGGDSVDNDLDPADDLDPELDQDQDLDNQDLDPAE